MDPECNRVITGQVKVGMVRYLDIIVGAVEVSTVRAIGC